MKQFFRKSTSSCVNDTTHTLKPTQMVQSVSRKWQLFEQYNSYFEAYTDGSKCEQKVAVAAFLLLLLLERQMVSPVSLIMLQSVADP